MDQPFSNVSFSDEHPLHLLALYLSIHPSIPLGPTQSVPPPPGVPGTPSLPSLLFITLSRFLPPSSSLLVSISLSQTWSPPLSHLPSLRPSASRSVSPHL